MFRTSEQAPKLLPTSHPQYPHSLRQQHQAWDAFSSHHRDLPKATSTNNHFALQTRKILQRKKNISFKSRFLRCQPRWKCQRDCEQDAKAFPAQPPISVKTTSSQQLGQLHGCNTDPVRGSHCVFFSTRAFMGITITQNVFCFPTT